MKPSYVAVGVLGMTLGALWYSAGGASSLVARGDERLRVSEPISHQNLAVYFVHGPDVVDDSRVITLQEALERKQAVVHETGQVNALEIENLSPDHELFVQSGGIIKGGRQDRMIATDLLLRPRSGRTPVAAHCVEQSRWAGRGDEAASHFAVSNSFAVGNPIKIANASRDQGGVWENVKVSQDKLSRNTGTSVNAVVSPTSLQLALENPAVRAKVEEYRKAIDSGRGNRAGVVGVVFVVNGKVTSAELYGSSGLFQKAWPKLLKAASEEALAEKAGGRPPTPPSVREVESYLASAGRADEPTGMRDSANETLPPVNESLSTAFLGRSGATQQTLLRSAAGNLSDLENAAVGQAASGGSNRPPLPVTPQSLTGRLNRVSADGRQLQIDSPRTATLATQPHDAIVPTQHGVNPNSVLTSNGTAASRPNANRINMNRVEHGSSLILESRDAGKKVIHRSYIKK